MARMRILTLRTRVLKRCFDILVAGAAAVALLPLFLVLSVMVRTYLGSPVLFTQRRPGRGGRIFTIYKFRTMTDERDSDGNLLPDGVRLTRFGRFLRTTSLDELPELINVLAGDMSLVGPRPLLPEYLPYYSERESLRHAVRPGLTGWAQVNGRNFRPWKERLELDVWYVENWSIGLDLKILALTALKVIRRDGVAADSSGVEGRFDHQRAREGSQS